VSKETSLSPTATERYRARFRRVLEHIDMRLDETLGVDELSRVAAFSKFHFHRQFAELFGLGVYRYVQLRRLKRAAFQLAYRDDDIIEVALGTGYEGPEAFARAFKKTLGQTPSQFRRHPEWEPWHALYEPLRALRNTYMTADFSLDQVTIVDFPATRVATLQHRGPPRELGASIRKFIEWRKANGLPPRISATFNLLYDDPHETRANQYRFDLCAATSHDIAPNPQGVVASTLAGGRCAKLRFVGSDDRLEAAVRFLYSHWLPQSGEELRDFPLFLQRVTFFPDVPEHEAVVDIFLPLA
jgi:AraC family transcriptional regulator